LNGGDFGDVDVAGTLDASGVRGGSISIKGETVNVAGTLRARGLGGDGGEAIILSYASTRFTGDADVRPGDQSGAGGYVEVSSKGQLDFDGRIQTGVDDRQGHLLLDPVDTTIVADGTAGAGETEVSAITDVLDTGTEVTILTSNDFALQTDLIVNNPAADGGDLNIRAGRSITLDGAIETDNGKLTVIANQFLEPGLVDAERAAGAAVLEMKAGSSIDTGTAAVDLRIVAGDDKTEFASGAMTLADITGSTITALNEGLDGGDVILNGTLTASAGGDSVVVGGTGNFVNNTGAAAIDPGLGRYLIYSTNPTLDTDGGLGATPVYNTSFGAEPTASFTGDRFLFSIAPSITVTADNQSRDYGDANLALTYTITGLINGDSEAAAVSGAPVLTTLAEETSTVDDYSIVTSAGDLASAYNYGVTLVDGTLTVDPAILTVTADNKARDYGDANPPLTGGIAGFKNKEDGSVITGSAAYSTAADAFSTVGGYTIDADVGGMTATNYVFADVDGTLTVDPATLTVTAANKTRIYGDANPTLTGTITGFKNSENDTVITGNAAYSTTADAFSTVAGYTIDADVGGMSATNYMFADVDGILTVNPATLTVTAANKARIYGDANPTLTGTITGFKNGEDGSVITGGPIYSTAANVFTNVGGHTIATNVEPMSATNYVFDGANGTLTINPATLTVTAANKTRLYGDPNPTLTGAITGYKNNEDGSVITGSPIYSTAASIFSNVSAYTIATNVSLMGATNYIFAPQNAALTVLPAPLTVIADDALRVVGDPNPLLTGRVTGFKNGDTEAVVAGLGYFTIANLSSEPGDYIIEPLGGAALNYTITVRIDGILSVLSKDDANRVIGELGEGEEEEEGDEEEGGGGGIGGDRDPGSPFGNPLNDFDSGGGGQGSENTLCSLGFDAEECGAE
jgi:hypothetical protein